MRAQFDTVLQVPTYPPGCLRGTEEANPACFSLFALGALLRPSGDVQSGSSKKLALNPTPHVLYNPKPPFPYTPNPSRNRRKGSPGLSEIASFGRSSSTSRRRGHAFVGRVRGGYCFWYKEDQRGSSKGLRQKVWNSGFKALGFRESTSLNLGLLSEDWTVDKVFGTLCSASRLIKGFRLRMDSKVPLSIWNAV